ELERSGELERQRRDDARHQILAQAQSILLERIRAATPQDELDALVARVAARELDPHTAAEELASAVLGTPLRP
ncbi:MAG: hypothetical protein RMK15_11355, partial [Chloroflexota bacterium]|nr:hypothetical protein [Dehalococcoidia bacterium]MDW8047861.1 hypothetical protein [Chloroflexota bacterium]